MVTCVLISMLGDFGTVGRGFESHRKYHISLPGWISLLVDSIVPEVILNSVALVLTISMRVFVCVSVRLCMFECVYSRPSVEVTHVIATSHWCTEPSLLGVARWR